MEVNSKSDSNGDNVNATNMIENQKLLPDFNEKEFHSNKCLDQHLVEKSQQSEPYKNRIEFCVALPQVNESLRHTVMISLVSVAGGITTACQYEYHINGYENVSVI